MLKILYKVFTYQNGGNLLVDLFSQSNSYIISCINSFLKTFFSFISILYKSFQKEFVLSINFIAESSQVNNFYHHSPKEWVSVPMPPFLR